MDVLGRLVARVCAGCARMVRSWFEPVEDEPAPNVVLMPGPAHGPVPAIDIRLERQRRRAS